MCCSNTPNGETETHHGEGGPLPHPIHGFGVRGAGPSGSRLGHRVCTSSDPAAEFGPDPDGRRKPCLFGVDLRDGDRSLPLLRWSYDPEGPPVHPEEPDGPTGRMVEILLPDRSAIATWLADGGNGQAERALYAEPRIHIYRYSSAPDATNRIDVTSVTNSPLRARHGNEPMPIWCGQPYAGMERTERELKSMAEWFSEGIPAAERGAHAWEAVVTMGCSEDGAGPSQPHCIDVARALYDEAAGEFRTENLLQSTGHDHWIVDGENQMEPYHERFGAKWGAGRVHCL